MEGPRVTGPPSLLVRGTSGLSEDVGGDDSHGLILIWVGPVICWAESRSAKASESERFRENQPAQDPKYRLVLARKRHNKNHCYCREGKYCETKEGTPTYRTLAPRNGLLLSHFHAHIEQSTENTLVLDISRFMKLLTSQVKRQQPEVHSIPTAVASERR
jgi:hypothetical protein